VHLAILTPTSERLALVVEQEAKTAPQGYETHVCHDRWYIAARHDPWGDKLRKAVAPEILVDCDADEDTARNGLVGVHGVCGNDGGERSDLNTGASKADDNNSPPIPTILEAKCIDEIPQDHDQHIRNHGR